MFLWMFIEGIVLHHMTTVAYSRGPEDQTKFYISGWGEFSLTFFLCTYARRNMNPVPNSDSYSLGGDVGGCQHLQQLSGRHPLWTRPQHAAHLLDT